MRKFTRRSARFVVAAVAAAVLAVLGAATADSNDTTPAQPGTPAGTSVATGADDTTISGTWPWEG
ncbi:hypothetical protein ACWT_0875 [Actinoplanes sp. SE50]|uniref:hypothetical protein n=1 Tax=unclassified Actinoplanes TaxID=2626549 RepID=UPI00023EC3CC|nr:MULTISPECIES: hypothetical protein [unclassified Actinoplanes]AEV81889.1 hypothetical protein ACPL_992 [Actinoplanes sp. SE50/110]ATO80290.1 hypothetical protein ACWT_0875 [Actinoplanes sp. SE50]SLL97695.1 hypothetical protein ACSP50_0904 [Actinoplanes sp. SE50/110]